jgi:outer membrane protein assembly factor BamB
MLCALSILALALGLVNAQPSGASWPMLGGGAGGASFSLSAGRRVAPSALWAFGANKTAYPCTWCPPAVGAGGIIYALGVCNGATSLYSQMVALGPAGDLLWAAQHANASLNYESTPALTADGAVLFGNSEGTVALDAATGALRWRAPIPGGCSGPYENSPNSMSPVLAPGGLAINACREVVLAVDAASGAPVWQFTAPAASASILNSVAVDAARGRVFVRVCGGARTPLPPHTTRSDPSASTPRP